MEDMKELNKRVRTLVLNEMNENDVLNERLLYSIPYKEFYLTQPSKNNEVALKLENVIMVAKEKIINQYKETIRVFELYDENLQKIGTGEQGEKFIADKEILSSIIETQQRALDKLEGNYKIANIDTMDNEGRIESYFEMVNRKLVVMNEKQKEKYDRLKDNYERNIFDANYDKKVNEKGKFDKEVRDNIENNNINNKEDDETMKQIAEQDLGFEVFKMTPIEDDLFYDNNQQIDRYRAFLIVDTEMKPQIVTMKNGKMEKADGFDEATKTTGEAAIMRNDDKKIEQNHTYGEIRKNNNGADSFVYSIEFGTYGDPKLLEMKPNRGSKFEQKNKYLVHEVQTGNTDYEDVNREGNTVKNITRQKFSERPGYNDDSHPNNTSDQNKKIVNDMAGNKESDFTPEDLAESKTIRLDNALKKVKEELNEQGIKYDSSDMKKIKNDVEQDIEKDEDIFCDEKVEQYVKNFIEYKKEQKQEQKTPKDKEDEGINRLEQILQKFRGY
jgi:hypothetical protein